MDSSKAKILFIVNPKAGVTPKFTSVMKMLIEKLFDTKNFDCKIEFTTHPQHATKLAETAVRDCIDIVVATGGDGTVNEIARALVNSNTKLGILPTGSGNGLARHLRIPLMLPKALKVISLQKIREIDTLEVNGMFCASIAGIGFDAMVAKQFARSEIRGLFSYMRIVLKNFVRYNAQDYMLTIDQVSVKRNAFMISFANSDQFGFKASIAPQAAIDDGFVDICVIQKPSLYRAIPLVYRLFNGTFGKTGYAEYLRGQQIQISNPEMVFMHIDGDPVELNGDMVVGVKPLSLKVIVP